MEPDEQLPLDALRFRYRDFLMEIASLPPVLLAERYPELVVRANQIDDEASELSRTGSHMVRFKPRASLVLGTLVAMSVTTGPVPAAWLSINKDEMPQLFHQCVVMALLERALTVRRAFEVLKVYCGQTPAMLPVMEAVTIYERLVRQWDGDADEREPKSVQA